MTVQELIDLLTDSLSDDDKSRPVMIHDFQFDSDGPLTEIVRYRNGLADDELEAPCIVLIPAMKYPIERSSKVDLDAITKRVFKKHSEFSRRLKKDFKDEQ